MTTRQILLEKMLPGVWYKKPELMAWCDCLGVTLNQLIVRMRDCGQMRTMPLSGNTLRYRLVAAKRSISTRDLARKELFSAEKVPLDKVVDHAAVVGAGDVWRGKTWEDMPGNGEFERKCNFALWRRGRLKYDIGSIVVGKGLRENLAARGLMA